MYDNGTFGKGGVVVMGGDGFFCFSAHSYKITKAKFNKRIFTMNTTITDTQRDIYIYISFKAFGGKEEKNGESEGKGGFLLYISKV